MAESVREPAVPAVRGAAPTPTLKNVRRTRPMPVALRDPMALRALDPTGVEQLIGPPNFVRHDGGAIIWQYTVRGCVMDLFWYRSDSGLSLLHMEAREVHTPRSAEMRGCLDNLWQARSEQAES